ncbi:MAG: PEP-CTERM sorting domain-containing protein [Phycisphaerales bacterium]
MREMKCIELLSALAVMTAFAGASFAAPVTITDGLGDADRNNDGTTDGSVVSDAGDTGIKWLAMEVKQDSSPNPDFSIVDDSAGIGSGNAVFIEQTGSNAEVYAPLGQAVSLDLGETLTMSFDIRYDTNSAALTGSTQLRFGLWNADEANFHTAGPTEFGAAEGDFDAAQPGAIADTGFQIRVNVGTSTATPIIAEEFNLNSILGGSGDADSIVPTDAGGTLPAITDDLKHTITMIVSRTIEGGEEGTRISVFVDGVGNLSGFEPISDGSVTSTFEWDYLAAEQHTRRGIQHRQLQPGHHPEPASLALMGLGLVTVLRRRK